MSPRSPLAPSQAWMAKGMSRPGSKVTSRARSFGASGRGMTTFHRPSFHTPLPAPARPGAALPVPEGHGLARAAEEEVGPLGPDGGRDGELEADRVAELVAVP